MAKRKTAGIKVSRITNKELQHIQKMTGDKKMSKARIHSGRWHLPTSLDVGVYKYLKRKGRTK